MTPATLQSLRRLLFFSVPEAAVHIGGVTERSWRMWESGQRTIPQYVKDTIRTMLEYREELIESYPGEPYYFESAKEFAKEECEDESFWHPHCSAMAELEARRVVS